MYTAERYSIGVFGERSDEWLVWWILCSVVVATVALDSDRSSSNARVVRWDEETSSSSFATT